MLALEHDLEDRAPGGRPAWTPRESVRFEAVSFRYPSRADDAISDFTLEIDAGTSVALVGANGAGKTTIVKLLAGLVRPTEGRVTVDGVPLDEVDRASWQRQVAAVFQDFARIRFSPADAIGLGSPGHDADQVGRSAAAAAAGAAAFIEGLPAAWATPLDRSWDGGVELSGGQCQRLALARALFAVGHGAGILVLDEPAAQLDARGEADLHDRFLEITRGITTVVVSHRFSTVRRADRIVVVDRGAVLEDGTHDDLVALGGIYARYFRLQADAFDREPR
jgi:ABC-type multidrug transport system fused ATPase/permease subunit